MRHKRIGWVVATATIVTLMSSCDGPGQSATSDPAGPSSGGSSNGGSGSGSSGGGFSWVPFGPSDPTSPIPGDWPQYNLLAQHQCGDLMRAGTGATDDQLWRALDALCAAAVSGEQEQWDVARTAFNEADRPHFTDPCLENAARALLKRALAWHEANPGVRPAVHFPVSADKTECGEGVVQPGDEPDEPSAEPDPEPSESDATSTTAGP